MFRLIWNLSKRVLLHSQLRVDSEKNLNIDKERVNKTETENSQNVEAGVSYTVWKTPPSLAALKESA